MVENIYLIYFLISINMSRRNKKINLFEDDEAFIEKRDTKPTFREKLNEDEEDYESAMVNKIADLVAARLGNNSFITSSNYSGSHDIYSRIDKNENKEEDIQPSPTKKSVINELDSLKKAEADKRIRKARDCVEKLIMIREEAAERKKKEEEEKLKKKKEKINAKVCALNTLPEPKKSENSGKAENNFSGKVEKEEEKKIDNYSRIVNIKGKGKKYIDNNILETLGDRILKF